jgi:hypothetical protein
MSITPVGGWGNGPNRAVTNVTAEVEVETHCCPSCRSTDWKAANLVHLEGLSKSRGQIRGTAIGIGRTGLRNGQFTISAGAYRGEMRGTSQTVLSQMAAPPKKSKSALIVVGFFTFLAGGRVLGDLANDKADQSTLMAAAIAVTLVIVFFKIYVRQEQDYSEAIDVYDNMRMCQRCGTFYEAL